MPDNCQIRRWDLLKKQLNNLSPEAFKEALASWPNVVLVDCRTSSEFEHRHLEGAYHMDYLGYDFLDKMDAMDPEKTYLIYCRTGRRSVRSCTLLKNAGFDHVYNLDGGLVALQEVDSVVFEEMMV